MLFYAPEITTELQLPEIEAMHCIKVLRKKAGDIIQVTDGKGSFYQAEITEANIKHCRLKIFETRKQVSYWSGKIEIAIAPTKNMDRNEWFAEKATELGIDKISFLNCRYSERKEIKTERIEKILISAMKQSLKACLPQIQKMTDFKRFVEQDFPGQKFIAHCYPEEKKMLSHAYEKGENVLILIGPEGDFSEEEVAFAKQKAFVPISLGESRLRTETAALTACQTIHIVNQLK